METDWPKKVGYILCFMQPARGNYNLETKQGNSVARDLPPTGSEANTTSHLHSGTPIYIPI